MNDDLFWLSDARLRELADARLDEDTQALIAEVWERRAAEGRGGVPGVLVDRGVVEQLFVTRGMPEWVRDELRKALGSER